MSDLHNKYIEKTPLKPKTPFNWVFGDIIPVIYYKSLTKENTFANYLLIVVAYSKIPKMYGMENITTEEVMYNLDMFQASSGKVDEFCWWDMERIQNNSGTQLTSK